jgi:HK97 gp10 family phage protein
MEVTGLIEVVTAFSQAAATIGTKADAAVDKTKGAIRETATADAPVDDGELRDSIQETDDGVVATAPHARFVEDGTYKDPPQPYMGPATDQHEPEFVEDLAEAAGDI